MSKIIKSQLPHKQQLTQRMGGVKSKNQKKNNKKKVGSLHNNLIKNL